jgi:ferredoxin
MKSCSFLARYGTPKAIAETCDFTSPKGQVIAYECSLCGLCDAVCPEKLGIMAIFLEGRRLHVAGGNFRKNAYWPVLVYEKWGISPFFSWYGLPEGCETVFFPGCALPGTRPEATFRMFCDLRRTIPRLGVVLDCCTKPSLDLGRQGFFHAFFGEMCDYLTGQGIKEVVVACPSCCKIFRQYGGGIAVTTVYEHLHANGHAGSYRNRGRRVSVHDPCVLRDETSVHQAVRGLLRDMGMEVTEMVHSGRRTICCGAGGMVGFIEPGLSSSWSAIRRQETAELPMITYCSGCTEILDKVVPTSHIADLLYRPDVAVSSTMQRARRSPFTYLNRLRLKRCFKKEIPVKTSRVRRAVWSLS